MAEAESAPTRRVAVIDLGTVSSRLSLARVVGSKVVQASKRTVITDLGEGVDATGRFTPGAIERVAAACADFADEVRRFGAEAVSTTLTSAARDASNAGELLDRLRALGLEPQVIAGDVEARLTFLGVARDFEGQAIAVADSGGGSTELAVGSYEPDPPEVALRGVTSIDVGCRRATDRFLGEGPVGGEAIRRAAAWARDLFDRYWEDLRARGAERPDRLVAVGGTVTTLAAMKLGLASYDSSRVHLAELALADVDRAIARLAPLSVGEIARIPVVQPKRAPVLLGGAVVIGELMRSGGYDVLTVSENGLLAGAASTLGEVLAGAAPAIGWTPRTSH